MIRNKGKRFEVPTAAPQTTASRALSSPAHQDVSLVSLDDADLVEHAKGGLGGAPDPEAFGVLYERYASPIFAFALRKLRDRVQAEDVTAQTFLQALRSLPRYQQRGVPIRYWFFRIAANLIADLRRAPSVIQARIGYGEEDARGEGGGAPLRVRDLPDPFAEAAIAAWERDEDLLRSLDDLTPEQRTVIRLRFAEDWSIAEIAAQMARSEGAVKALLCRGLRQLRGRWAA